MSRKKSAGNKRPVSKRKPIAETRTDQNTASEEDHGTQSPQDEQRSSNVPIVGIGASAGGLAAFESFFAGMPVDSDPDMAFVLVQHLAPNHKSILTELVRRYTRMQVYEVTDGIRVEPNCTYIIPPGRDMALLNGELRLLKPAMPHGLRLPIDFFFRSLAHEQRERAICVVLSGTGSDGTLGVRAVRGEGGTVMAQDTTTTEFDGMPRSAIGTGLVDYVLPPGEMARQLIAFSRHAFGSRPSAGRRPSTNNDVLSQIAIIVRDKTGHDFSQYKQATLGRRVERRMSVHQIDSPEEYVDFIGETPGEAQAMFRELLIGVTSFFRDKEAFEALESEVIPKLFAGKPAGASVRVWVCGCATGEEAYSIAILLQEHLTTLTTTHPIQIFATDLDSDAIDQARTGVFPASIATDVSAERLARFFTRAAGSDVYRVHRVIRDHVIFSEQDVIKDPPLSKLDMICCRNLLIYLNAELQRKLLQLFHYALNPGGRLLLGTSETLGEFAPLFDVVDRKQKLFRKERQVSEQPTLSGFIPRPIEPSAGRILADARRRDEPAVTGREVAEHTLLAHFRRAAVLINGRGEIVYIHGRTGKFLEPAEGDAGMNVVTMARDGLRPALTSALQRSVAGKKPVEFLGLRVRTNGDEAYVNLTVRPAEGMGGVEPNLFLVILEDIPTPVPPVIDESLETLVDNTAVPPAEATQRIATLEREVRTKDEYLQSTIEQMETTNEELKSTNEEMQSVNEELQSTNEELETSKEELQSVNEELATVNTELQIKVSDLSRVNNDMNNLLAGTGVGTLFVDHELRIARFTPAITEVIHLIQGDVGRPVAHVASNLLGYDRLVEDIQGVLNELVPFEKEVQTKVGEWYMMRIRPYRTLENVIEGAVIAFVDITDRKRLEASWLEARDFSDGIVATIREPLVVLDAELRVFLANSAFIESFQTSKEEMKGQPFFELRNGEWNHPGLRALIRKQGPEAQIPGMQRYVFSSRLSDTDHSDVSIVRPDRTFDTVRQLKNEPGKQIWLFGGGQLFSSLLSAGLVDQVEVAVFPILLGEGVPLLPQSYAHHWLEREETTEYERGVLLSTYRVISTGQ